MRWLGLSLGTTFGTLFIAFVSTGSWTMFDLEHISMTSATYGVASVVAAPAPDLTPDNVWPTSGVSGIPLTFQSRAWNNGTAASGAFNSLFQVNGGSSFAASTTNSLAVGASNLVTGTYTFSAPGTYQVRFCADLAHPNWNESVNETDENNNCGGFNTVTVSTPGAAPNLTAATLNHTNFTAGTVVVSATIFNTGATSTPSTHNLFDMGGGTLVAAADLPAIAPGAQATVYATT
ncbi:MAG: CARDB domain-containing protein, partial [Patescibacteria group bacterium]